ncbi:NEUTRAL CERAMIDASE [Salix koriyanagi]|uniref:NEUTRAL CERAMIDASE n=1 Tax=Salix koriyanagi TaxID=2511006 RepID=A0A9Q0QLB9_9ROSI|nr:NEUTRAL CERAMIDASE [Salix koriyanagi]
MTGKVNYRHVYQNFSEIEVELSGKTKVRTCPAALGPGFAAGTTDGPGMFGFQQGDTEVRTLVSFLKMFTGYSRLSLNDI